MDKAASFGQKWQLKLVLYEKYLSVTLHFIDELITLLYSTHIYIHMKLEINIKKMYRELKFEFRFLRKLRSKVSAGK